MNGGAWLLVGGGHVYWSLRDLDRVRRVWADCQAGGYEVGYQNGHPLGFWSPSYAGEVALGRVLADPGGELTALRAQAATYPLRPILTIQSRTPVRRSPLRRIYTTQSRPLSAPSSAAP